MKPFFKTAALSAALAFAAGASTAQADLIAFWGFDSRAESVPQFTSPLPSDLGADASASLSFTFVSVGSVGVNSFGGSTINLPDGYTPATNYDFAIQGVQDGATYLNNGESLTISVDTTGYENIALSMKISRTATGFNNNLIEYSTNGGVDWTTYQAGWNPPTSNQLASFPLGVDAADEADLQIRFTLDGADSNTGNNRFDNIRIDGSPLGTGPTPVSTSLATAYTSSFDGDEVVIRFNVPPGEAPEAGEFTLSDAAGVTVTNVEEVLGELNTYRLTLSGPASGDTTIDTLGFDNGFDDPASIVFYAGIMDIQDIRDSVDTAGDWLSTLEVAPGGQGGYNVTVRGIVVDQTVSINGGRNMWVQQGDAGIIVRGNFGEDFRTVSNVGDEILFAGNVDHFNGALQILARTANNYELLLGNNGPATVPTPGAIDFATATAFDYEANEGTVVVLQGVEMVDAGSTFGGSAANYAIVDASGLIDIRIQGEVAGIFDGQPIPAGSLNITGVLGQFDNSNPRNEGYQVQPRSLDDIEVSTSVRDWSLF